MNEQPIPAPAQVPSDTAAAPEQATPPTPSALPENGSRGPTDPNKFFKGAKAMDRLKGYLKDVPILHARLTKVIDDQEDNLTAAKKALQDFADVTVKITETVDRWEAEEKEKEAASGGARTNA